MNHLAKALKEIVRLEQIIKTAHKGIVYEEPMNDILSVLEEGMQVESVNENYGSINIAEESICNK